jgi:AcrR family transcriptional regulator
MMTSDIPGLTCQNAPVESLRADARRNREQIIAAARSIFAGSGLDAPMEEIARSARVGVGTLYRRFTDRDALIKAVLEDNLARILDETRAAVAEEPTAWQALVRLLTASVRMRLSVHLAVHFRHALTGDPDLTDMRSELLAALDDLVRTAQRDGDLRPDAGTGDVAQLSVLLLRPELPEAQVRRSTAIMIDGLRAAAATGPLPGTPPRLEHRHREPRAKSGT